MRYALLFCLFALAPVVNAQVSCDVQLVVTPITCPGEDDGTLAIVTLSGGPFTYEWSHDFALNGATASDITPGDYEVYVSNIGVCDTLITVTVEDPIVPALGTIDVVNISCAGEDDGSVTFTVNAGPYTWEWLQDPNETATTLTDLAPGFYGVVIDGGACPSFVIAELGDPDIVVIGNTDYCPSDPPVLNTEMLFGFSPDVFLWTTGDTTPTITIVPGTEGDVQVVAVDTATGCVADGSIFLTQIPSPTVAFSVTDTVCERVGTVAITTMSDADSLVWRWGVNGFSNEQDVLITLNGPHWEYVTLQGFDAVGCGNVPVVDSVYVQPRIPAIFTAMQIPCTPEVAVELGSASDSCAFFIDDSLMTNVCDGYFRFDLERYRPYTFTLYSTQPNHCDDTTSVTFEVRTEPTLFLPNAFTPNNDGINDLWPGFTRIDETGFSLRIFDRWGTMLFETKDTKERWDGSSLPEGTYTYIFKMRDPCEPRRAITKNGFITLLR